MMRNGEVDHGCKIISVDSCCEGRLCVDGSCDKAGILLVVKCYRGRVDLCREVGSL